MNHQPGIQFYKGMFQGFSDKRRFKQFIISISFHCECFYFDAKNSAIGPSVKAGKKESAAIMAITANTIIPKVPVSVFKVPALSGTNFFLARIPAMASGPIIGRKRANSIIIPSVIFQNGVFAPRPANSEPLLADAD